MVVLCAVDGIAVSIEAGCSFVGLSGSSNCATTPLDVGLGLVFDDAEVGLFNFSCSTLVELEPN